MTENFSASQTRSLANPQAQRVAQITDTLLRAYSPGALIEAAQELYSLLSAISSIDNDQDSRVDSYATYLTTGKAISPKEAGRCVLDFARTSRFLRGIYKAIIEAQTRFLNDRIEILYAGCGPLAPLAMTLATQFNAQQVQFTLIDIHQGSLDSARLIFHTLELEDRVASYIQADACSYVHDSAFHLVITETMQRALEKEPQVAVTRNVVPQLRDGGLLVPKKIIVAAYLYDPAKEFSLFNAETVESINNRTRIELGPLMELTMESVANFSHGPCLPPVSLTIAEETNLGLLLTTNVEVFDSEILGDYDSAVTCPVILHDFNRRGNETQIQFQYFLGSEPGFKYRWGNGEWQNLERKRDSESSL
jgi:predicted RNA methylase